MKFNRANSSFKLFCKEVQVINSRPREIREWTVPLRKDGIDVLDPVRFVYYDILETEIFERRFFDEADLVVCNADFEILRDESVRNASCARLLFP
jgi:hypothetical protein